MDSPTESTAVLMLTSEGEIPFTKRYSTTEKMSYRIDEPQSPGCLKIFYGRKTVLVPLRNLLLVEFDL